MKVFFQCQIDSIMLVASTPDYKYCQLMGKKIQIEKVSMLENSCDNILKSFCLKLNCVAVIR